MDFFQFLQNSKDNSPKKNIKRKNKSSENNDRQDIENQLSIQAENGKNKTTTTQQYDMLNIKRGDYVKIIGLPNSNLNSYKGYIGEIKDYKQDQDFALVFLHCITALSIIKFPLKHLIKLDN